MDASSVLSSMGLEPANAVFVSGIDLLQSPGVISAELERQKADSMVIEGHWRPSNLVGIDIYDLILKFAEDNFHRIRSKKSDDDGRYLVIVSEPINDPDE